MKVLIETMKILPFTCFIMICSNFPNHIIGEIDTRGSKYASSDDLKRSNHSDINGVLKFLHFFFPFRSVFAVHPLIYRRAYGRFSFSFLFSSSIHLFLFNFSNAIRSFRRLCPFGFMRKMFGRLLALPLTLCQQL